MIFQDSYGMVYMYDETDLIFQCTTLEFKKYESSYEVLQSPYVIRRWTNDVQYINDGLNQVADSFYSRAKIEEYFSKITEYQSLYVIDHPEVVVSELPNFYAILTFSGGDGKSPIGINLQDITTSTLQIDGWIGVDPLDVTTKLSIPYSWRITICKVRSEKNPIVIDSFVKEVSVVDGEIHISDFTISVPGIYMISDEDFDNIDGATFGLSSNFKVTLYGGSKFFKVIA